MKSIFVAIAAYNEKYIDFTVNDLISKASGLYDIRVGVVEQSSTNNFACLEYKNVTHFKQHVQHRTGVGRQRLIALQMNHDSDYVLQIDAHCTFSLNWDKELVSRLEGLGLNSLISQHLPVVIEDGQGGLKRTDDFQIGIPPSMVLIGDRISKVSSSTKSWYFENYYLTAHFMFAAKHVYDLVMPDPDMFFWGEEHSTSMRMWTRGIRMYSTDYMGIGHLDKGNGAFNNRNDWKFQNHTKWINEKDMQSVYKMYDIMQGCLTGYWGAPNKELANEFIEASGTDLDKLMIHYR